MHIIKTRSFIIQFKLKLSELTKLIVGCDKIELFDICNCEIDNENSIIYTLLSLYQKPGCKKTKSSEPPFLSPDDSETLPKKSAMQNYVYTQIFIPIGQNQPTFSSFSLFYPPFPPLSPLKPSQIDAPHKKL